MTARIALLAVLLLAWSGSTPAETQLPRDGYGRPDLNGIWQAMGTAHWSLEPQSARMGPVVELGALGAAPAALGGVDMQTEFVEPTFAHQPLEQTRIAAEAVAVGHQHRHQLSFTGIGS